MPVPPPVFDVVPVPPPVGVTPPEAEVAVPPVVAVPPPLGGETTAVVPVEAPLDGDEEGEVLVVSVVDVVEVVDEPLEFGAAALATVPDGTVSSDPPVATEGDPPPPQAARPTARATPAASAPSLTSIGLLRSRAAPFASRSGDSR